MHLKGTATLLRVFLGESDKVHHQPLSEAIVRAAREAGLAGATVIRGIEGFGAASRIHTAKILRLSEDLPVLVEIIDARERITAFVPTLHRLFDDARCGGMVTLENVEIIRYFPGPEHPPEA